MIGNSSTESVRKEMPKSFSKTNTNSNVYF